MEKLHVKIKIDEEDLKNIEDLSDLVLDIIYEYILEKQTEILFKINWKMQIVNPKHFVDHFIRILPSFKQLQFSSIRHHFAFQEQTESNDISVNIPHSEKMIEAHNILKEEIEDCIDSVSKLAPLVP